MNTMKDDCKAIRPIYYLLLLCSLVVTVSAKPHGNVETQSPSEVCYEYIGWKGCFRHFETDPENMPLPMSPEEVGAKFILYRQNQEHGHEVNITSTSISEAGFNRHNQTKIIIHGFSPMQDTLADFVPRMTRAILQKEDVNVIVVNWVSGANVEYDQAAQNTRLVGALTAYLMQTISENFDYDSKNFHVIGFSLGAHVAGFSGKEFQKIHPNNPKIGRISGLDPANPGFNYDNSTVRLDRSDAEFVDVMHTDIRTVLVMAGGMNRNLGHADFYPNGGNDQPGCNSWNSLLSMSGAAKATICDHTRAPEYYISSINNSEDCSFAAYKCPSYAHFKHGRCVRCRGKKRTHGKTGRNRCQTMGYYAQPTNTKKQVQYYLQTSDKAPFCAKHYQIQVHWRKGKGSSKEGFRGSLYVTLHGTKESTEEVALNDGVSFHIRAGNTSRFLVSQDCTKDIGDVVSVSLRWERPTCWTWYFCKNENVYLRRIKIFDAAAQRRRVFFPLDMDRNGDGRKDIFPLPAGVKQELFEKTYIRQNHPAKFVPVYVPELREVNPEKPITVNRSHLRRMHHQKRTG